MKKILNILGVILIAFSVFLYSVTFSSISNLLFIESPLWSIFVVLSTLLYFVYFGFFAKLSFQDKLFTSLLVSIISMVLFAGVIVNKGDLFSSAIIAIFSASIFYFLWYLGFKFYSFLNKKQNSNFFQKEDVASKQEEKTERKRVSFSLNKYTISIFILVIIFIISFIFLSRSKEKNIFCLDKINYSQKLGYYIKTSNQNKYFKTQEEAKEYCKKIVFPLRDK